jgi:hypothetical protein
MSVHDRIRQVLSMLQRSDAELAKLAASLSLPPDTTEMWNLQLPESFEAHLYATIETVRTDCLQGAVDTLLRAARHNDASLRQQFLRLSSQRTETR